jgi:hypothetical protein
VSSAQYLSVATDGTVASRNDRNDKVLVQVRKPYSGMTKLYRGFILIIVFCKFSICIALCIFGSAWIFSSDKAGELILNTLASVFIFQVDDIVYRGVMSKLARAVCDPERHYISFGRLEKRFSNKDVLHMSSFWIKVCATVFMAVMLNWGWCNQGFRDSSAGGVGW